MKILQMLVAVGSRPNVAAGEDFPLCPHAVVGLCMDLMLLLLLFVHDAKVICQ
jgi:hypothetical protein